MFVACGMWCLADVSSVSPSSEQTGSSVSPSSFAASLKAVSTRETGIMFKIPIPHVFYLF